MTYYSIQTSPRSIVFASRYLMIDRYNVQYYYIVLKGITRMLAYQTLLYIPHTPLYIKAHILEIYGLRHVNILYKPRKKALI